MKERKYGMDTYKAWADVASVIVGAPPGFKLFRHTPFGWGPSFKSCDPSGPLHARFSDSELIKQSRVHGFLLRNCPTFWFSYFTPCAKDYELRHCRRTLTRSAIEAVERRMAQNGRNESQLMLETVKDQIRGTIDTMASDQRLWMLRLVAYVATKVFCWLFGCDIYVNESSARSVQKLQKTHTVIYAPTHKSHLDSVMMGYVAFAYGLEPPHIVAGDNLRLPLISKIMRMCGAFFIRRSNKNAIDREIYKKSLKGKRFHSVLRTIFV